ncbi:DUF805 domain-containing protein [Amycolatopsis samaneae]|uniref:DUF805 domain-containing protein n=2 Tax=Amycolatopsis samaneae TaxID=664691 RepID=A0ABW5GIT0_9PSEU
MIRRLHDTGRSGGWWFITWVPFGSIVLVVFLCLPSDYGVNRYGPEPDNVYRSRVARGEFRP